MRLTRRGYGVLALVAVAEILAYLFGARALNAVAAPAAIALVAGIVQVYRSGSPVAERGDVEPGFPGETREVPVAVEGSGVVQIAETVPRGLTAEGTAAAFSPPGSFSYELALTERGAYALGPLRGRVRDSLGLFEETYEGTTAEALVYPPVYRLVDRHAVFEETIDRAALERQEFASLREYVAGDPLRDVHWKASAKSPDALFVTEYADRRVDEEIVVAATAEPGFGDEMATAAASLAVATLDAGLGVELRAPDASVPLGYGAAQREEILAALATADTGALPDREVAESDVRIHADASGTEVGIDSRTFEFEAVIAGRENPITGGTNGVSTGGDAPGRTNASARSDGDRDRARDGAEVTAP